MRFFDVNCFIGLPTVAIQKPVKTAGELLERMDRAGIEKALVWHVCQRDYAVAEGNRLLAEAIAPHKDRLTGCWAVLPNQWGELPPPQEFCEQMVKANVKALRVFPGMHNFLLRQETLGPMLEVMVKRRIPLILPITGEVGWPAAFDLLRTYPKLRCILSNVNTCGTERQYAPLLAGYSHVYLEMSEFILDGGIEAVTARFGAEKLLFGTGFPRRGHGGAMLALQHAAISAAEKAAIAAGNLETLLNWE